MPARVKSFYQERIGEILKSMRRHYRRNGILAPVTKIDPRHIEAYMELGRGCLDGLSREEFVLEVEIGIACIEAEGAEQAERLAQSFGL
jgi:hypothetical protein